MQHTTRCKFHLFVHATFGFCYVQIASNHFIFGFDLKKRVCIVSDKEEEIRNFRELVKYGNEKLNEIKNIEFCFSGNGNSELSIDHIRFAPAETSDDVEFIADETCADTFFQKVSAKFGEE